MTPDPAPYGADLPRVLRKLESVTRNPYFGLRNVRLDYGEASSLLAAAEGGGRLLAAADETIASLRAERDALRQVVEAVRAQASAELHRMESAGWAGQIYEGSAEAGARILALLPAPTEEAGRG